MRYPVTGTQTGLETGTVCERAWSLAVAGESLPPDLAAHAANCPNCQRLVALDALLARRARVPIAPGAALRAALAADPAAVTLRTPFRRALVPALVMLAALVATAALTPVRGDLPGLLGALLLAITAAAGTWLLYHRGTDGLGPAVWVRRAYPVVAIGLITLVALAAPGMGRADAWTATVHTTLGARTALVGAAGHGRSNGGALHDGADRMDQEDRGDLEDPEGAGGCASYGLVLTLLTGAALLAGGRRTVAVDPVASGACAGVAAGLLGAAALGLHGAAGPAHVLVAHGLPVVVGGVLGAAVGRRVLAP